MGGEGGKQWVMCVDMLSMVVVTWKVVGQGFRQYSHLWNSLASFLGRWSLVGM